jgi:hypothetical protein
MGKVEEYREVDGVCLLRALQDPSSAERMLWLEMSIRRLDLASSLKDLFCTTERPDG